MRGRGAGGDAGLRAAGAGVEDTEVGALAAIVGTDRLAAQTLRITPGEKREIFVAIQFLSQYTIFNFIVNTIITFRLFSRLFHTTTIITNIIIITFTITYFLQTAWSLDVSFRSLRRVRAGWFKG